jgi:DNA-binding MarR family transcriptional regulator
VYKQELNHHACRIATRQSNLFPAIHGFKADYTCLHSYTVGIGHHLPTIPRANGILGKDNQPVNDIAHRLLLETNTVTPLLQRMEKIELVKRQKGKLDKRQHIVRLTKKGREMEEKAYALIPTGMGKQLSACPMQLEDYQHLAQELDSIISSLK